MGVRGRLGPPAPNILGAPYQLHRGAQGSELRKAFVSWKEARPRSRRQSRGSWPECVEHSSSVLTAPRGTRQQRAGTAGQVAFIPRFLQPLATSPVWHSKGRHLEHSVARSEGRSHCPWPSELPLLPEDSNQRKPLCQGKVQTVNLYRLI